MPVARVATIAFSPADAAIEATYLVTGLADKLAVFAGPRPRLLQDLEKRKSSGGAA